ncbi:M20 family metallo-hydrolase [Desulforhopalus singaporensis]|nr:M20 family metallo-hydrolase [Desulforhopalus singaporensis]
MEGLLNQLQDNDMKVNCERLWATHMDAAEFTELGSPYTRRSFTPQYREMRNWLTDAFLEAGLKVKTDGAGNLHGIYSGTSDRNFVVGSHTDTVPCGGRFDGISGVLTFLEIARCMKEAGFIPCKNIVGIDFLAEEPSEFRLSCIGSRLATGNFTNEMLNLQHRESGMLLSEAIQEWGGNLSLLSPGCPLFDTATFDGFLELHIEQGPVLENENLDVGLVTGICSVTRYDFSVQGRADHAGNTPMDTRSDAVVAASKVIDAISEIAQGTLSQKTYFTATVGKVDIFPNGSNIIAERVDFTLDIRSEDNLLVQECLESIFASASAIAKLTNTTIEHIKISQGRPSISDGTLLSVLEKKAKELGLGYTKMLSGAGHDAAYMSTIMPMAMIFIPCKGGRSHSNSEYSSKHQIEKGANLLLKSLVELTS